MGYLEGAFAQYAYGARPPATHMKDTMAPLSAEDIKALIHYYASQQ